MLGTFRKLIAGSVSLLGARVAPERWKRFSELRYWRSRKKSEGELSNEHYRHFYTSHFGIDESEYEGGVLLDIGCGPRGSLEWASMAGRRIGLDPLADDYLRLGADRHAMEYVSAPSEAIPLEDASCDAVFSFNSLDHVESVEQTVSEIKRVTKPGGRFLLLVEVNHPPTACEPHELSVDGLLTMLAPEFMCDDVAVFEPVEEGMYQSIKANIRREDPRETTAAGYLSARFTRAA
jgi:ubiquinone/menaquinone biosynthesis C-methylase UbiE